ncbi:MAG: threonine/serine dehydratase [Rhodobacteraceae bacterium]|nr:threonine/serine dehydratase [Paracoccaceae bacterium]
MTIPHAVTRDAINAAYPIIAPHIRRTPVLTVSAANLGLDPNLSPIALKLEFLQYSGSFKARGATYNLMTAPVPEAGVVAASGGNHGAALAWAARRMNAKCKIFVFSFTPKAKIDRIKSFGAEVEPVDGGFDELMSATHAYAEKTGARLVHAYDEVGTLTGQGTCALEFMEDCALDTLLVAVGGGGLIGGIAAYVAGHAKVVAVEPEAAPTLHMALEAGRPIAAPAGGIAADSLGPAQVGNLMFPIAQSSVNASLLVPDSAIAEARQTLWDQARIVTEPGGATALAALLSGAYAPAPGERVGVVLCGANTDAVSFG